MTISQIFEKMIAFSDGNIHDIDHLIRVWTYAKTIGELEGLDEETQFILEVAAITHDIACPLSREKYGNINGKKQEEEGAILVREFLADTGMTVEQINRVSFLVGHHHTMKGIEGADYQILIEADYIANASENGYSKENVQNFKEKIAKTESGKRLIEEIYFACRSGFPGKAEAERLLAEAETLNSGPWIAHSRNVAKCAEVIAVHADLNPDKAYILGLLHDVGRRAGIGQLEHVYYGWKYMMEKGYPAVAKVCLTHSYNTHRFEDDMAKIDVEPKQVDEVKAALAGYEYDDYDRLIQLCDSIATAEGIVDVTERMTDVKNRYGSYPQPKWDKNIELPDYFTEKTGRDIYELCGEEIRTC